MDATTIKVAKKQVKDARKQEKGFVGWTDGTIGVSVGVVGTLREASSQQALSDDSMVLILVVSDELQRWSREDSSVGWTDDPLKGTVGLSDDQVWTRQRRAKINAVAPDEPTGQQRFIRRSQRS
jgi:hypothetical protein